MFFSKIFQVYLYADDTAPRYILAMSVNSAFALVAILLALNANHPSLERGVDVAAVMKGESEKVIAGVSDGERRARKEGFRYIT